MRLTYEQRKKMLKYAAFGCLPLFLVPPILEALDLVPTWVMFMSITPMMLFIGFISHHKSMMIKELNENHSHIYIDPSQGFSKYWKIFYYGSFAILGMFVAMTVITRILNFGTRPELMDVVAQIIVGLSFFGLGLFLRQLQLKEVELRK